MAFKKDELKVDENFKTNERRKILKNIVIIGLAFMLQFTAYCGAVNLQSSINATAGLGTASLVAAGTSLVFSNIFLPAAIIKWLGTKWAICFSLLAYMPYIAVQMYPTFYTLIPAGVIAGLGAGPLWCAQCTYLALAAEAYSKFSKTSAQELLVRFLGLFFMIFQSNQIWGNLISSFVLTSGNNTAATTNVNATMIPQLCGANFLPNATEGDQFPSQPAAKIQMLSGIYLTCMAAAALLIAVGVDSVKRINTGSKAGSGQSGFALLAVTLKHCTRPTQQLLIVINIFNGVHQAFFFADFTASFVSCTIGTGYVGFVMMMFGLSDAVGCLVTGYFSKVFGRLPLIIAALFIHAAVFITMLIWRPQAEAFVALFAIALLWGICDSIWTVQMTGYYGVLFADNKEAAFSSYRLWESLGGIIAYSISPHLRTRYKIHLLISMMVVGVCGYFIVEFQQFKMKKQVIVGKNEDMQVKNEEMQVFNVER